MDTKPTGAILTILAHEKFAVMQADSIEQNAAIAEAERESQTQMASEFVREVFGLESGDIADYFVRPDAIYDEQDGPQPLILIEDLTFKPAWSGRTRLLRLLQNCKKCGSNMWVEITSLEGLGRAIHWQTVHLCPACTPQPEKEPASLNQLRRDAEKAIGAGINGDGSSSVLLYLADVFRAGVMELVLIGDASRQVRDELTDIKDALQGLIEGQEVIEQPPAPEVFTVADVAERLKLSRISGSIPHYYGANPIDPKGSQEGDFVLINAPEEFPPGKLGKSANGVVFTHGNGYDASLAHSYNHYQIAAAAGIRVEQYEPYILLCRDVQKRTYPNLERDTDNAE